MKIKYEILNIIKWIISKLFFIIYGTILITNCNIIWLFMDILIFIIILAEVSIGIFAFYHIRKEFLEELKKYRNDNRTN